MEKAEKSIKRWLKKKVKLTLATVVMFLITGTISYSMEIKPTNNVWENKENNIINEQVSINNIIKTKSDRLNEVISSGITINNNGNIEIEITKNLENKEEYANLGNGIGIFSYRIVSDSYTEKVIKINEINNKSDIKINITENLENKGNYVNLGNGIGIYSHRLSNDRYTEKDINIKKISNNGKILISTSTSTEGVPKVPVGGDSVGNGIGIYLSKGKTGISIGEIDNSGTISSYIGEIKNKETTSGNKAIVGNGIGIFDKSYKNLDIGSINNSGTISGRIGKINFDEYFNGIIGNGIGIYGNGYIKISKIINSGTISGFVEKNNSLLSEAGNGIYIIGNHINVSDTTNGSDTGHFLNTGDIKGNINLEINKIDKSTNAINSGNGILFKNGYSSKNKINNFYNYGSILGSVKISTDDTGQNFFYDTIGNGIKLLNVEKLSLLKNEGKIEGEILENKGKSNSSMWSGNGILILNPFQSYGKENIIFSSLDNNGIISGKIKSKKEKEFHIYSRERTGNGFFLQMYTLTDDALGKFTFERINNSGLIEGNIKNLSDTCAARLGNGALIESTAWNEKLGLKIGKFTNDGLILGRADDVFF